LRTGGTIGVDKGRRKLVLPLDRFTFFCGDAHIVADARFVKDATLSFDLTVLRERLPPFIPLLEELPKRAGTGTVTGTLEEVVRAALAFYDAGMPMMASLFAERELLVRHRDGMKAAGRGPHLANRVVAAYIRAEQRHGRISRGVAADAVAALLLGACLQRAFFRHVVGEHADRSSPARFAREIVGTVAL